MLERLAHAVAGTLACSLINTVPGYSQSIGYTADGFYDAVTSGFAGDWAASGFEIFGMGYVQQGNSLVVGKWP